MIISFPSVSSSIRSGGSKEASADGFCVRSTRSPRRRATSICPPKSCCSDVRSPQSKTTSAGSPGEAYTARMSYSGRGVTSSAWSWSHSGSYPVAANCAKAHSRPNRSAFSILSANTDAWIFKPLWIVT